MAQLSIYLPDEDKAIVEERAKANGISASEYARHAVIARARLNKMKADRDIPTGREKW